LPLAALELADFIFGIPGPACPAFDGSPPRGTSLTELEVLADATCDVPRLASADILRGRLTSATLTTPYRED